MENQDKLKSILFKFLEQDYKIADEMYLEKLLNKFSTEEDTSGTSCLHTCIQWLQQVVETRKVRPLQPVFVTFAVRTMAVVVKDAQMITQNEKEELTDKLITVLKLRETEITSIKLAYINMLSAFLKGDRGSQYLIKSELWKDAVKLCHEDVSIYVTRESYTFLSDFLKTVHSQNEEFYATVLFHALSPLMIKHSELKTDDVHLKKMIPVLDMAGHIFEVSLHGNEILESYKIFVKFNLESLAWALLNTVENSSVVEKTVRLLVLAYFIPLECKNRSNELAPENFKEFQTKFYNMLSLLISKGLLSNCMKAIVQCQFYWQKTSMQMIKESDKDTKEYSFENQLIMLQLVPILCNCRTKASENECLDSYCNKLFDLTYQSTQRMCYCIREYVISQENRPALAHMAVLHLMQIKNIMHRDQAIVVFQALMYSLKDFVPEMHMSPNVDHWSDFVIQFSELLSSVLEFSTSLIRSFHITWRESVETICLFTLLHLLLKNPNLASKTAVQSLQLMQEVIKNFMPPNLALLVNTLEGSSISQLGPLLYKRMHDTSWEVRDSALEVLNTVAHIAEEKFTAFQEHVLENDLCSLCVALAMDDAESYVRSSALSCLSTMVKVHTYWSDGLSMHNLPMKMMTILKEESEGIVRREAATLLRKMYEHQKITKSLLEEVYLTMAAAATRDLYWEVQVNVLDFWRVLIDHHMANQGMIDGAFPSVTFSREDRKIVTLTEKEVQNRLHKVLEELSHLGCLQVLLTSLEDCSFQVVRKSALILTSLSDLLMQYSILPSKSKAKASPLPDVVCSNSVKSKKERSNIDSCTHQNGGNRVSSMKGCDQVIESIVKESDMKLLQHVYQNKMNVTEVKKEEIPNKSITAQEFIAVLSKLDLADLILERTRWLDYCADDFGSLLDDILNSAPDREAAVIDCY